MGDMQRALIVVMIASMSRVLNRRRYRMSKTHQPLWDPRRRVFPCAARAFTFFSAASQIMAAMSAPPNAADLPDAGRRGDVDLGDVVADDVDAGEDEAAAS